MRSLSLHYGTIQIASVAGESRRISVSGLAKARLLWLFRNFSILEFPVLSKAQQQLIFEVWNSGVRTPSKEASRDVIGKIEAFSPQLCAAEMDSPETVSPNLSLQKISSASRSCVNVITQQASVEKTSQKLCSGRPGAPRVRFALRAGLRGVATWRVFTVLLMGAAMYFGPRYLPPKRPLTTQPQAAAADEKQGTDSAPAAALASKPSASKPAPSFVNPEPGAAAEPASPAAALPLAETPSAPVVAAESFAAPSPTSSSVRSRAESNTAPAAVAPDLPEAMAREATLPQAPASHAAPSQAAPKPPGVFGRGPQEVLIRVSVDAAGQAQSFHVVKGYQENVPAALNAARLWNYKPCAGGGGCDQVLKFTDYGDSSRVQRIR